MQAYPFASQIVMGLLGLVRTLVSPLRAADTPLRDGNGLIPADGAANSIDHWVPLGGALPGPLRRPSGGRDRGQGLVRTVVNLRGPQHS